MAHTRRQLTLFIKDGKEAIEKIRAEFNPVQYSLIPAHVTLCREEEIEPIHVVVENMRSLVSRTPLRIGFDAPERSADGKGLFLPAKKLNTEFEQLRKLVLKGVCGQPKEQLPHITLMHPRNSVCTDAIFDQVSKIDLPTDLCFDQISLIEQTDGGKWRIVEEFSIVKANGHK